MTIYVDQNAGRKGEPKNRHGDGQNSTHSTEYDCWINERIM